MSKATPLNLKPTWRKILIERRKAIDPDRRKEAALLLLEKLKSEGTILSFTPIGTEIDVSYLNEYLKQKERLFLIPYRPEIPQQIPLSKLDCILVPGLGFDKENYRIGYGKGIYDQFLAKIGNIRTIGIGFKEQFCEELLPRDPWDIPLQELLLV